MQPQQQYAQPQPQAPYGYGNMAQPGMIGPNTFIYQGKWGFEKLREQPGVFIHQKFDAAEAITGCERENRYNIYAIDANGDKKGHPIFKAQEKSGFLARCCLPANCQPFNMRIRNQDPVSQEIDGSDLLRLEREFKCTFCCLNRPEMTVRNVERGADELLGKIVNPFLCCAYGINVLDATDKLKYVIRGDCCQAGIICKGCPCQSCQLVQFSLNTPDGAQVGSLEKRSQGCLKAAVSDADNFSLVYPPNSTEKDKALLMASILLLDFSYFESNPGDRNSGRRRGDDVFDLAKKLF